MLPLYWYINSTQGFVFSSDLVGSTVRLYQFFVNQCHTHSIALEVKVGSYGPKQNSSLFFSSKIQLENILGRTATKKNSRDRIYL